MSGAGRTTLTARIAALVDGPHTEIDGLHHGPAWTRDPNFWTTRRFLIRQDAWTTERQYAAARPLLTERAGPGRVA